MYIPKYHDNENKEEQLEFIRQNNFGLLISQVNDSPWATHVPLMLSDDGNKLSGHIARGNKQWKSFPVDKEVLVVFSGPHTYISSSWYDHENVPTWNYVAVHVYGKIRMIEGPELKGSLKHLVDHFEADSSNPVSLETMTPSFLETEIKAIVGFEITITKIEASYKLSQNRDKKNHQIIIEKLNKRTDSNSHAIAEEMKKKCPY